MQGICQACQKYANIHPTSIVVAGSSEQRKLKLCGDCKSNYEAGNIPLDFIKEKS